MKLYKNYQKRYYLIQHGFYWTGRSIKELLFNIEQGYAIDRDFLSIIFLQYIKQYNNIEELIHDNLEELIWY